MVATALKILGLVLISSLFPLRLVQAQGSPDELATLKTRLAALEMEIDARRRSEAEWQARVQTLEQNIKEQAAASAEEMKRAEERLSGKGSSLEEVLQRIDSLEAAPSASSRLAVGGYFDIEYRAEQARRTPTFDQHRLVLKFDGDVNEYFSFKSEIEFEGGGSGAGFLTGNLIIVEFAEAHIHLADFFNIKAGALLVPFGRLNYLHDSPLQDLTDRPLVDQFIVPTTWQEVGVGVYGFHDFGRIGVDWDLIVTNGFDDDFDANPGGGFRNARSSFRTDNNENKQVTGRLGITPDVDFLDAVNFGFSFLYGQYDDDDDQQITMFGFDWTLKKGPFELLGEYAQANLERGPEQLGTGIPGGADGFYVQLNYHFFFEGLRNTTTFFTDESTFTLVFRFGTADTDDSAHGIDRGTRGDALRDDVVQYVVGFNFRPVEKVVFKVEYQINTETGDIDHADNNRFLVSMAVSF